jgi:serine/threonine-protein kinase
MAIVYEARDAHLGRKVAIKVLPPELTFGRGLVERFRREARTAATLDHPHIIPIFRVSTGGRLFWYVMKYLEGESLAEHVKREGAQLFDVAVDVLEQVADALQYAHDHGVVHRDVKPANVMLDQRGWVTVTDFGIAKAASEQSMTGSGSMIGTPYYMSPEQCSGKKVTGSADQYSLGVMAYEMLSGRLPFTGDSTFDIIRQHCMDPPPPLREVGPKVPSAMAAVVERALSKSPDDRYPSVWDFAAALRGAWGASSEPQAIPSAHRTVTARSARGGLSPTTPRTPRSSVTVDVGSLPPVPTEALTPEEPRKPAPERKEPRRPAPRPMAPPRPRPAPLALLVEQQQKRQAVTRLVVVAVLALAAGSFGAWKLISSRGAPSAPANPPAAQTHAESLPAVTAQVDTTASAAAPASAPAAASPARLVLRGIPSGALISRDGQRVRDTAMDLEPRRRHIVAVQAAGFEPWADTLIPRERQRINRTVRLRPLAQAAAAPVAWPQPLDIQLPPRPAALQLQLAGQSSGRVPTPAPPTAAPATRTAAEPTGAAYLSVESEPKSSIYINDEAVPFNPVQDFRVPAGEVRLRFYVTDGAGTWSYDTTVTVAAGQHRNLGRIALARTP